MAAQQTMPDKLEDFAKQEIRLAAVLNGGVSLAVWMSGVTLEMHHLAMASQGLGSWPTYRAGTRQARRYRAGRRDRRDVGGRVERGVPRARHRPAP